MSVRIRRLLGLLRARRLCVLGLWGLPWTPTPTRHYAAIRSGKLPADRIYCVNHILSTRVSLQSPNAQKD